MHPVTRMIVLWLTWLLTVAGQPARMDVTDAPAGPGTSPEPTSRIPGPCDTR